MTDPIDDVTFDDNRPPSEHLADFDVPTFQEELRTWLARSHELYKISANSSDLRSSAAAIQTGLRSLEQWAKAMEAEKANAQPAINPDAPFGYNEAGQPYLMTPEISDRLIREYETYTASHGLVSCPACASANGIAGFVPYARAQEIKTLLQGENNGSNHGAE